ncbi:MAG: ROK family protein [Clostridia bacterium]
MAYRLGVDIGGTTIKFGVIDENYNIVEKTKIATEKELGADAILNDIISSCKEYMKKYDISFVGVGSPGRLSADRRSIDYAGNLPFEKTPIADTLQNALSLPVMLDNDGNCAVLGEKVAGKGKIYNDLIVLTIGTGIGGGIMVGGKVYHGSNNMAGELGHFVINCDGPECSCGLNGCFEKYASITALISQTASAVRANPKSILAEIVGGNSKLVDGKTAFQAASKGCDVAKSVLYNYMRYLAIGINSLVKIFQPEAFVLSGGVTVEGDEFMRLLQPRLISDVHVRISNLKNDAGIIGASALND